MRGQWLHSRSTALPQANGELQRGAAVGGDRLRLRAVRQSGGGETAIAIDDIGTGFRHDTGFVNQAGVRKLEAFHSFGWQGLGPFNDFYVNAEAEQVRDRLTGQLVREVLRPGIWFTGSSNLEASLRYYGHVRTRTAATAPLLKERYVSGNLTITPAAWFPLLETSADLGRLADTAPGAALGGVPQGEVRRGARWNLSARLRPLRSLEFEPRLNTARLEREGQIAYRETSQQWLSVWHFDARNNLRAIVQRSVLDRRAETGVAAADSLSRTESLTYASRLSAGTRLYVGGTRTRVGRAAPTSSTEAFVKLELYTDDLRW
jgi:hypothetical protein